MTALDDLVHWFDVDRLLHAVWTRTSEPPVWIADATNTLLQGISGALGVPRWNQRDGSGWPESEADRQHVVESWISRDRDGNPLSKAGYELYFVAPGNPAGAEVTIFAGDARLGTRLPLHTATVRPRPLRGTVLSSAMVDQLCVAAVQAWQPARVEFSSSAVRELYGTTNNWSIDPAWRLWLSDEVGPIEHVTEGVTATRMHGGTMLAVPDDFSAEQVVETMGPTLRANDLIEIPH